MKNRGEIVRPSLELLIIVTEESTINATRRNIGRFATTFKFLLDAVSGSEIISIYCSFCFPDYYNTNSLLSHYAHYAELSRIPLSPSFDPLP